MTPAVAWVAFVLAVAELVFLAGVTIGAGRAWRKLRPTVEPLLSMFSPPGSAASSPAPLGDEHGEREPGEGPTPPPPGS